MKQIVFLSGLPRTGSTLLSAILSQNPKIHAEGNSALCQIMWDMQISCDKNSKEQLAANNREKTTFDMVSSIPNIYYKNINETIVLDKCRTWTLPANVELLTKYIDSNFKIIVLERPVLEVVASFAKLYKKNNVEINLDKFLLPNTDPITRPLNGIFHSKQKKSSDNYLYINYNDLVNNTEETIQKIYSFCGWEKFKHDFTNVKSKYPENDKVYGLDGQHTIRENVKVEKNDIVLPDNIIKTCKEIDTFMGYT